MSDLRIGSHSSFRDGRRAGLVLALGLAALFAVDRTATADSLSNGKLQWPYLVPGHGLENACPKAAAELPESAGRIIYASDAGQGDGIARETAASLEEAVWMATPGDSIVLLPGNYGELSWPPEKSGTESDPITIRAEHPAVQIAGDAPDLVATPVEPGLVSTLSLKLKEAHHVRIDGIFGRIEVHKGSHIELVNNHHLGNDGQNIELAGSTDVSVHGSLIENFELRPGYAESWLTDYGAANYYQQRVAYHNNVFNGGFNHAISLKTNNSDITISCNRFNNCGRRCIELGQQTDGRLPGDEPTDRTSERVLVKRNLFEMTDETYVNADYPVMIMNADDVVLEENRFTGPFAHSILLSNYWEPTYCSSTGELMSQVGVQPNFVRIADNHFEGSTKIRITGRGVAGDTVEIGKVSGGPVSCEVMDLAPITCDTACCAWDPAPASEHPPDISLLDDSIDCR